MNQAPPRWAIATLLTAAGVSFMTTSFYLIFQCCEKCKPKRKLTSKCLQKSQFVPMTILGSSEKSNNDYSVILLE